jgi:hypothetical protein
MVVPGQKPEVPPLIAAGTRLVMVSTCVAVHPSVPKYDIVVVPTVVVAETKPNDGSIVATDVLLLLHVPPLGVPVSVVEVEIHIVEAPPDIVGVALTVTVAPTALPQPVV